MLVTCFSLTNKIKVTHSSRKYDSQKEHRQQASSRQPSIEHVGCPSVEGLLVLALKFCVRVLDTLERTGLGFV